MSAIQDLRDKIHRRNGKSFSMTEINPDNKQSIYTDIRRLLQEKEIDSVPRTKDEFIATSSLQIRKILKSKDHKKIDGEIVYIGKDLKGWREVFPDMFKTPSFPHGNVRTNCLGI
jgi:hypothetical protein